MTFGERFESERKNRNLSVSSTAKACGISRSYIVLIETGRRHPSAKILPKIAKVFELPVNEILNWYLEDMRKRLTDKLI